MPTRPQMSTELPFAGHFNMNINFQLIFSVEYVRIERSENEMRVFLVPEGDRRRGKKCSTDSQVNKAVVV